MTNEPSRILIVDADYLMLFGLTKALERQSFEVDTATTARQAVRSLDCRRYDLCMVNIHLPDFNGLELMKVVKGYSPETVVILMAASFIGDSGFREDIIRAVDQETCFFIAKPFNLVEAIDLIIQALEGRIDLRGNCRLAENGYMACRRRFQRKPFVRMFKLYLNIVTQGEVQRNTLSAIGTDISDGGVGLLTRIPLKEDQIVSFDEELTGRSGVVAWSTMLDHLICRAGIRFT